MLSQSYLNFLPSCTCPRETLTLGYSSHCKISLIPSPPSVMNIFFFFPVVEQISRSRRTSFSVCRGFHCGVSSQKRCAFVPGGCANTLTFAVTEYCGYTHHSSVITKSLPPSRAVNFCKTGSFVLSQNFLSLSNTAAAGGGM